MTALLAWLIWGKLDAAEADRRYGSVGARTYANWLPFWTVVMVVLALTALLPVTVACWLMGRGEHPVSAWAIGIAMGVLELVLVFQVFFP